MFIIGSDELQIVNRLLNILLKKKFDWFKKVEITYMSVVDNPNFPYLGIKGRIFVDSDWGHKQWREYYYSTSIPEDYDVSFGDIIGGELSKQIQEIFFDVTRLIIKHRVTRLSWELVRVNFVDDESISESVLIENTNNIDNFINELNRRYKMSDELTDFVKKFIEDSGCKKIEFSDFFIPALGVATHDYVLISKQIFNQKLPMVLFVIFHETAHQYQFKKYGNKIMYDCYLGDISIDEAADFMKKTEEVADEFAARKLRELQNKGLLKDSFVPPQFYKNVPIQSIKSMINQHKTKMMSNNIDSPDKISEYFYNLVKNGL